MGQLGRAGLTYGAEARGAIPSFSWEPGKPQSRWADLNVATEAFEAHANQAVDILRRMRNPTQPTIAGDRLMDRNFTYLALVDGGYFGDRLPEPAVACPEDMTTLTWQKFPDNPAQAIAATGDPDPDANAAFKQAMPFWSTYQCSPYAWSPERGNALLTQYTQDYRVYGFQMGITRLTQRRVDEVMFPSQKMWLFDLFDRHQFKRVIYHAYPVASQPLLAFDGSVTVRRTRDCNLGWNPLTPNSAAPTIYSYAPTSPLDPPTLSGAAADQVFGYYRWTRKGLGGVDWGGKEPR
jgi:hypothetical protein